MCDINNFYIEKLCYIISPGLNKRTGKIKNKIRLTIINICTINFLCHILMLCMILTDNSDRKIPFNQFLQFHFFKR